MKIVGAREGWAAPSNGRGQWDGGKVRNGGRVPRCREGRWQRRRERTERARGDPGERRGRAEAGGGRGAGPLDGRAWQAGRLAGRLAGWHWAPIALGLSQSQSPTRCGGRRDKWCQQNCRRNGVAYGMRRGKCRGRGPDLDGDVRSEGLTGSIAGVFLERR